MKIAFHGWKAAAKWSLVLAAVTALFIVDGSPPPKHARAEGERITTYYLKGYAYHRQKINSTGARDSLVLMNPGGRTFVDPQVADTTVTDSIGNLGFYVTPWIPVFGAQEVKFVCRASTNIEDSIAVCAAEIAYIDTTQFRATANPASGGTADGNNLIEFWANAGVTWLAGRVYAVKPLAVQARPTGPSVLPFNYLRLRITARRQGNDGNANLAMLKDVRIKCAVLSSYQTSNAFKD